VLEGEAHRVTDSSMLEHVAAAYRTCGWPESRGEGFTIRGDEARTSSS
jgi:hypothetical protein